MISASMVTPRWFAWPVRSAETWKSFVLGLERGVPQVAPEDGRHARARARLEGLADFLDLPRGLGRAEIDRGADGDAPMSHACFTLAKRIWSNLFGIGEQLVVVELQDEGDAVRVFPRNRAEDAERGGHCVAAALDREPDDVLGIEVAGFGAKDAPAECSIPWSTGRIER